VTGPREWRHADGCGLTEVWADRCYCGLDAFRDAIAAGHRVVIGPDGVEGRLVEMGAYERRGAYSDPAFRVEEP
jgi:hypothetical protein